MSDRDVIAETISAHTTMTVAPPWPPTMRCHCGWQIQTEGWEGRAAAHAEHLADQIGDALRESRTVQTADEVPVGAVVRSTSGTIACRFDGTQGVVLGDDRPFPWHSLSCPLTILYRPDEDGAL